MRRHLLAFTLISLGFLGSVGSTEPTAEIANSAASVRDTTTVSFIGKDFLLKDKAVNQSVPVYEYFQRGDDPPAWDELVDFRIYPQRPDGNRPIDYATKTAKLFKQQYPYMKFALYSDKDNGSVLLDFFYPTSSRKDGDFLEFNAFKFFIAPDGKTVMSFHYAKNITSLRESREMSAVLSDIKTIRTQVLPAMDLFPVYRQ